MYAACMDRGEVLKMINCLAEFFNRFEWSDIFAIFCELVHSEMMDTGFFNFIELKLVWNWWKISTRNFRHRLVICSTCWMKKLRNCCWDVWTRNFFENTNLWKSSCAEKMTRSQEFQFFEGENWKGSVSLYPNHLQKINIQLFEKIVKFLE